MELCFALLKRFSRGENQKEIKITLLDKSGGIDKSGRIDKSGGIDKQKKKEEKNGEEKGKRKESLFSKNILLALKEKKIELKLNSKITKINQNQIFFENQLPLSFHLLVILFYFFLFLFILFI